MILTLALSAYAIDADPLADALAAELARNQQGLHLEDAPDTYYARYRALLLDQVDVEAEFGAVVRTGADPYRQLGIEWRIGTPAFDNSGFGGWQNGFRTTSLPARPPESVAAAAWRATDLAYKEAVEQYARKAAQVEYGEEHPGDYTLTEPVVADLGTAEVAPAEPLRELARHISGALALDSETHIVERGVVAVGHEAGVDLIVDTDGTRLIQPREETTIRAASQIRTRDGAILTDSRLWTVRQPSDLPSEEEMVAEARRMAEDLLALADAETMTEEYVGPVLFEDEAALDLFRYVLVPQLEGTPPDVPFDSFFGDLGGSGSGAVRLSRRVLPLGWTVEDDPTRNAAHPGSYAYDAEAVPAESVPLVDDGIVQTVLMSRTPRNDVTVSNGHARGGFGARALGRAVDLDIRPDRHLSDKKVAKKAKKLAAGYGRDWILVVKRLQEPSVLALEDYTRFPRLDPGQPVLPAPVAVYKRYADGHEVPIRGLAFTGVQRFVLRDIAAVGHQVHGSYLADTGGEVAAYGLTSGLPTALAAPEVLIGEMELVPVPPDPRSVPVVPPPSLTAR